MAITIEPGTSIELPEYDDPVTQDPETVLQVNGLPADITWTAKTNMLTASPNASSGSYPLTIKVSGPPPDRGVPQAVIQTVKDELVVRPASSLYAMSVRPATISAQPGGAYTVTVQIDHSGATSEKPVTIVPGTNAPFTITPSSAAVPGTNVLESATFALKANAGATPGSYQVTFNATGDVSAAGAAANPQTISQSVGVSIVASDAPLTPDQGRQINSYLLQNFPKGLISDLAAARPDIAATLQSNLAVQPNCMIGTHTLQAGLESQLTNISSKYPDASSPSITVAEGLRAIGSQEILNAVALTSSSAPSPTILVVQPPYEYPAGEFRMYATTGDMQGILSAEWDETWVELDNNNQPIKDTNGQPVTKYAKTVYNFQPPYPLYLAPSIIHPVDHCQVNMTITVVNVSCETAATQLSYTATGAPPVVPADPAALALANATGAPLSQAEALCGGGGAVKQGNWSLTWYGSIEVVLDPSQCKDVADFADAVMYLVGAFGTATKILPFLGTALEVPWYVWLILIAVVIQAAEVSWKMHDCVNTDKSGKLGFNVLTGIFYAADA